MTTKDEKSGVNVKCYWAPQLSVYGSVVSLTASGTRGGTEDPNNPTPDPRNKP